MHVALGQTHLAKAQIFVGVQLHFLEHLHDGADPQLAQCNVHAAFRRKLNHVDKGVVDNEIGRGNIKVFFRRDCKRLEKMIGGIKRICGAVAERQDVTRSFDGAVGNKVP